MNPEVDAYVAPSEKWPDRDPCVGGDAKRSKTCESRVEKFVPKVLDGKGFRDR